MHECLQNESPHGNLCSERVVLGVLPVQALIFPSGREGVRGVPGGPLVLCSVRGGGAVPSCL